MKKAIMLVSHGSVRTETVKALDKLVARVEENFPDYEVNRTFSAKIIIKLMKERHNQVVRTPKEELEKLVQAGYKEIIVQSLHILPALEFHNLLRDISEFQDVEIKIGYPLLTSNTDYVKSVEALQKNFSNVEKNQAVMLMGHGTYHPSNSGYACLQNHLNDRNLNFFIANVEGYPKLREVVKKLQNLKIEEVFLMPYMLTAGNHVFEDMIGEENSFKQALEQVGIKVSPYLKGLVEDENHQEIFIEHIAEAISGLSLREKFKSDI